MKINRTKLIDATEAYAFESNLNKAIYDLDKNNVVNEIIDIKYSMSTSGFNTYFSALILYNTNETFDDVDDDF